MVFLSCGIEGVLGGCYGFVYCTWMHVKEQQQDT